MSAVPEETFVERMRRLHRPEPERPLLDGPTIEPRPEDPAWSRRALIYCERALDSIAADLAATPEGSRNAALNNAALRAFRWVKAGLLDQDQTADTLRNAGFIAGLEGVEIGQTLQSAWRGAAKYGPAYPALSDPPDLLTSLEGTVDATTGEVVDMEAMLVAAKVRELRILAKARQVLRDEEHAAAFRVPEYRRTLTEELLIPDEEQQWVIDSLLPAGGNALLTAMFKAGKSSLCLNLLRAFADATLFLGRFEVHPAPGRIAIFNYELSDGQFRAWLRQAGIVNTDAVAVLNLRGYALPITAPAVQDWIVDWLIEQDVSMWIADPFARAAVGVDENSNTDVGVWLDTFDIIKERAGVRDGVLPVHTGRAEQEPGQERARGATRLDDWADVRWLLTKDDEGQRFFSATGRDVDFAEERLEYEETTRTLTMKGGNRAWLAKRSVERAVWKFVTDNPGAGVRAIREGVPHRSAAIDTALASLKRDHYVRVDDGPGRLEPHYATGKEYEL